MQWILINDPSNVASGISKYTCGNKAFNFGMKTTQSVQESSKVNLE